MFFYFPLKYAFFIYSSSTTSKPPLSPHAYRSKAGINKLNPKYSLTLLLPLLKKSPKSVISALKDPGWCQAMQEELDALSRNKTWILVLPPVNQNILGCKWVFKTKLHSDGTLDRLKARLVAKGFHQEEEEGIDFVETYSPGCEDSHYSYYLECCTTVRGWPINQLDVQN